MVKKMKVKVWYPKNIAQILNEGNKPQLYCETPPDGSIVRHFYATDMEVVIHDPKVTITELQLEEAIEQCKYHGDNVDVDELKRRLGFENAKS